MKSNIKQLLSRGDMRTTGRADEVAEMVLTDTKLFAELFACLKLNDPPVRMRAADALEKVTQKKPDLLQKYKEQILDEIAYIEQQEVQWHVAQMIPRLELLPKEVKKATEILDNYLDKTASNIVRVMSLQALADLALQGKFPREQVIRKINNYSQKIQAPSVRARSKRLLRGLTRLEKTISNDKKP